MHRLLSDLQRLRSHITRRKGWQACRPRLLGDQFISGDPLHGVVWRSLLLNVDPWLLTKLYFKTGRVPGCSHKLYFQTIRAPWLLH